MTWKALDPRQRGIATKWRRAALVPWLAGWLAAAAAAQTGESAARRLEALELRFQDDVAELEVVSSAEIELIGVQVEEDGRLVLQFPLHDRGPEVKDLFPEGGLVSAVQVDSQPTARGPLTRLAISTRRPAEHSVSSRDRRLRLRLWPRGELPPEAAEVTALRGQVMGMRTSLGESERLRDELAGRVRSLSEDNRELARRFEDLKSRRGGLDAELTGTLGELTEMVRRLSAESDDLKQQLRQAGIRESELQQQLAGIEAERSELVARLDLAVQDRDALAAQIVELEGRGRQLEADLAARRLDVERLEQEGSTLAVELDRQMAAAAARELELRAQLDAVEDALAESRLAGSAPAALPRPEMPVLEVAPLADPAASGGPLSGRTTEAVSLRAGPGTDTERLRVLPAGTRVVVVGRGQGWLQVRVEDGDEGWVHGDYLALGDPEAEELQAALEDARGEIARIREAARDQERQLVSRWQSVAAEKRELAGRLDALASELDASAADRSQLVARLDALERTRSRLEADLEASRAAGEGPGRQESSWRRTTAGVNLRRAPGLEAARLLVLPAGTRTQVLERGEPWIRVRAGEAEGWVHGDYLALEGEEVAALKSSLEAARAEIAGLRRMTAIQARTREEVNLFSGPGREFYFGVAVLPAGTELQVLGGAREWLEVRAGETRGWVPAASVAVIGAAEIGGEETGAEEVPAAADALDVAEVGAEGVPAAEVDVAEAGGGEIPASAEAGAAEAGAMEAGAMEAGAMEAGAFAQQLLAGARLSIERAPSYDGSYRELSYPGGDPGWERGTGADLIVRAFRHAGVDLQVLLYEDIARDPEAYGVSVPDPSISHRRVQHLVRFFSRAGTSVAGGREGDWRPGDVVIWDLDGSGQSLLIGLLSDRQAAGGHPLAIHHGQAGDRFSGYPSEGDLLFVWPVLGHFRWPPD